MVWCFIHGDSFTFRLSSAILGCKTTVLIVYIQLMSYGYECIASVCPCFVPVTRCPCATHILHISFNQ